MFGSIFLKIGIVLTVILAIVGYFVYTQHEISNLNREIAAKELALKVTTDTLNKTQDDIKQQQSVSQDAFTQFQDARTQEQYAESAIPMSNVDNLEKQINDAASKSNRCVEELINKDNVNAKGC